MWNEFGNPAPIIDRSYHIVDDHPQSESSALPD